MDDTPIGQLAVEVGYLTPEELEAAIAYQRTLAERRELGRILLERGHLVEVQLSFLLSVKRQNIKELEDYSRKKSDDLALADLLRTQMKMPAELLRSCLRKQAEAERAGGGVRLAKLLFERQAADREGLQDFLDHQGWDMVVCPRCGGLVKPSGPRAEERCEDCDEAILQRSRVIERASTRGAADLPATLALPPEGDRTLPDSRAGAPRSTPAASRAGGPLLPASTELTLPASGARAFGKYELLEEISRGGMGIVYRARQADVNRIVALKVLHTESDISEVDVVRFQREAHAAASLHHANIVSVIDVGVAENRHYLTMEYVAGQSLARLLNDERPPLRRALEIMKAVCDAIEFAHRRGIIHRDIKPGNILLDPEGVPRVTDFGLAKHVGSDTHLTRTGTAIGTPAYMSPEQADGDTLRIDFRSDVYGLGAVLYHLLTGKPPFHGETTVQTIYKVISHNPIPPCKVVPTVPEPVQTICLKAMEKDPAKRYATAAAMADDLDRWLRGEPILARPPSVGETVARHLRKHRALLAMSVVSFGVLIASEVNRWTTARAAREREHALELDSQRRAQEQKERFENEKRQIEQQLEELLGRQEEGGGVAGVAPARPGAAGGGEEPAAGAAAPHLARAQQAIDRKAWPAALEELERARAAAGDDARVRARIDFSAGLCHLAAGAYDPAVEANTRVLAADPGNLHARVNRGLAHKGLRHFQQALEDLSVALAARPADPALLSLALLNRALARMSLGDNAGARADLTALLELPDLEPRARVPAFLFRALCHMERGEFEPAIADNSEALKLDPKNLQALVNRGVCFVQRYQFDKGLADLSTAAAFEPTDHQVLIKLYTFRALCQYGLGNYPLAIQDNGRVLGLEPKSVQALTNRGLAYLASSEMDKALADLEKAVSLAPGDPYATPALAEARRLHEGGTQ